MNLKNSKTIKAISLLLATLTLSSCLFSCGNGNGNETGSSMQTTPAGTTPTAPEKMEADLPEFDFLGTDLSEYLTLPDDLFTRNYKDGLKLLGAPTDADVELEIKRIIKSLATKKEAGEGAVVEDGDTVVMDYVGKLDGEAFAGGSATDTTHDVMIVNSQFIDGFDKGLLGMKAGETKDLNLTFPDPYPNNTSLSGKAVVFTVTVDKITKYEYPELTDKLITDNQNLFGEDIKTAAQLRESVKNELTEYNKYTDESAILEAAWKYAKEKTEIKSYPEGLLDGYIEYVYAYYHNMAASYGLTLEQLAEYEGYLSVEAFKADVIVPNAKSDLDEQMILYHASKAGGVSVSEEQAKNFARKEYDENSEYFSQNYGIKSFDEYIEACGGIEAIKESVLFTCLINKIAGLEMPDLNAKPE